MPSHCQSAVRSAEQAALIKFIKFVGLTLQKTKHVVQLLEVYYEMTQNRGILCKQFENKYVCHISKTQL